MTLSDYVGIAIISLGLGFFGGQYLGKQEGIRQSQEQAYLQREFERRYDAVQASSPEDQEKLAVFMTGVIPEKPVANTRTQLEQIAKEGQKPRELLASQ